VFAKPTHSPYNSQGFKKIEEFEDLKILGFKGVTVLYRKSGTLFGLRMALHLRKHLKIAVFLSEERLDLMYCVLAATDQRVYQLSELPLFDAQRAALGVIHFQGGLFNPALPFDVRELIKLEL